MSDCCPTPPPDIEQMTTITCPQCGSRGASVELQTVKALLVEAALARIRCVSHWFCRTPECPAVYYDDTGGSYGRDDVRVGVWQKEPPGDRLICYCFGETEGTIRAELQKRGTSEAVPRVQSHIEAGRCACDIRNPRGVCCLGDLTMAVKRISGTTVTATQAV